MFFLSVFVWTETEIQTYDDMKIQLVSHNTTKIHPQFMWPEYNSNFVWKW